jgi:small subunit ribosomal protein S16
MGNGAQPTDTVKNLFSKQGIMKKFAEVKSAK